MQRLSEQEEVCDRLGEPRELAACLGNQALIYLDWEDFEAADREGEEALALVESEGTRPARSVFLFHRFSMAHLRADRNCRPVRPPTCWG